MEENNIKPPILPSNKKEKKIKPAKQKQQVQVNVLNSVEVENQNPVLVTSSKKKRLSIIISILLLAVILASTLFIVILPKPTSPVDINIDFQVNSTINGKNDIMFDEETELADYKLLPGDTLHSTYFVKSIADDENAEVYVRVCLYATVEGRTYRTMFKFNAYEETTTEGKKIGWIMGADGYYYMYGTLKANQMIEVTSNIVLDQKIGNEMQGKSVTLTFVGECLQAGEDGFSAIQSIWKSAPTTWKNAQKEIKG